MSAGLDFLPELVSGLSLYGRIALLLVGAIALAEAVRRFLHLPRLVGYVLAGLILGPYGLHFVSIEESAAVFALGQLGLGLLLFELGSRVDLKWLRANPALLATSLLEAGLTFAATFGLLKLLHYPAVTCVTVASIAVTTSPAVVMQIITESNARGQVTDRLLLLTALNCVYGITALHASLGLLHLEGGFRWAAVLQPLYFAGGAVVLGLLLALAVKLVARHRAESDGEHFLLTLALLMAAVALAQFLRLSVPTALLAGGILARLMSERVTVYPRHFGSAGAALVVVLFIATGLYLDHRHLWANAGPVLLLLIVRIVSKTAGTAITHRPAALSLRKSVLLGTALLPMSSIALLQAIDAQRIAPLAGGQVFAIVSAFVLMMEIFGPICASVALRLAGEGTRAARPRGDAS